MVVDNLFSVFDSVSERSLYYKFAPTVGALIREEAPKLVRYYPDFETDFCVFELGYIDEENGVPRFVSYDVPKKHSWDEYRFPETPVQRGFVGRTKESRVPIPDISSVPADMTGGVNNADSAQ